MIYTVTNTGIADLTLEQATVTGVPIKVAIGTITAPVKPKLAPGEETTFEVSYTPTAAGDFSFDLSIRNNDPDENPFKFTVKGTAAANPAITSGQNRQLHAGPVPNSSLPTSPGSGAGSTG